MPFLLAADAPQRIFVPWTEIPKYEGAAAGVLTLLLLAVVAGIYVYRLRRERREETRRVRTELAKWSTVRGLDRRETEALIDAIVRSNATSPRSAVSSEPYFREFVADVLARRYGDDLRLRVRDKLFRLPPPEAAEEEAGETSGASETAEEAGPTKPPPDGKASERTRSLAVGRQLRLTFEGFLGSIPGVVINVQEQGFLVGFIAGGGQNLERRPRLRVAGVFTEGTALYSFKSEVIEFIEGKMLACRIAHTGRVTRLRDRAEVRVKLLRPVRFLLLAADDMASGSVAEMNRSSGIHKPHDGRLRDISLGGCALTTSADLTFEKGDHVHLSCQLTEEREPVTCLGRIVGFNPFGQNEKMLHIEFDVLDDETRQSITLAMAQAQETGAGSADDAG